MLQVAWLVDGDPGVLLRLRGLAPDDLQAAVAAEASPDATPRATAEVLEGDLAAAVDAAARAARILALAGDPTAELGHLF
jgi:uncharacterized Zn finger protein